MPIVIPPATSVAALATTTALSVVEQVQRDLNDRFAGGPRSMLVLDYINRIQQQILGHRRWDWMLSTPQRFVTERGQSDYWIGPSSAVDEGMVDTGLNLSDVRQVKKGHLYSRSEWTEIFNVLEGPMEAQWQWPDGSYSEGTPTQYRSDRLTQNLISLYPAPDEGSDYHIIPAAPHSTTSTSGALSARTYYIRCTFVDAAGGESEASATSRQWVAASKIITVKAPIPELSLGAAGIGYTHYNVYASTTEGSEKLQNVSPTVITADWTEAGSGLTTSGAAVPSTSTIEPINGYLMEIRYYKAHSPITADADVLLIPDDYIDVVVAGVNWLASQYLHRQATTRDAVPETVFWHQRFVEGLTRMVKDQNPWGGRAFLVPDRSWQHTPQL